MKRRYYIVTAVLVLTFLIARFFYSHINGVMDERIWYIKQLHYDFSGRIDSIDVNRNGSGILYFHSSNVTITDSRENSLKRYLKFNGLLDFILFQPKGKTAISMRYVKYFSSGDSITVNTDTDIIRIYRKRKLLSQTKIIDSLNGRPF